MNVAIGQPAAPPRPRFTLDDANWAYEKWGMNCGPGALCGVLGKTPDEIRPHMGDFEQKGYTNPTLMFAALKSLGVRFRTINTNGGGFPVDDWPRLGFCRIQWEGPWTLPGVPLRARYRYTHWIGSCRVAPGNIGVFDINCINNGSGWVSFSDWRHHVVPHLTALYKRASGDWHVTHAIEIAA